MRSISGFVRPCRAASPRHHETAFPTCAAVARALSAFSSKYPATSIFVAGFLVLATAAPGVGQTPTVTIRGDRFVKNGQEKYLLFLSYFDAMRRAGSSVDASGNPTGDLDTDFAYLRTQGIDGIRIFPNWWHWCPAPKQTAADDALFTIGGGLRAETDPIWKRFIHVLNKAAEHDLLVDASFTAETLIDNHLGNPGGVTLGPVPRDQTCLSPETVSVRLGLPRRRRF